VVVAHGTAGTRRVPLDEVLVRSGVTTLDPDEIVMAVELPLPAERRGSVHLRRTRRRGHDLAAVTVAATTGADGIRIAYGSVGPRPFLVTHDGTAALDDLFTAASPSPRSMRATAEYRLAMLRVLGQRAVDTAMARRAAQ
jgi:CO/xanthine dehydrogenase FAD-binding subunit